jgi:hypothetical protein
MPERTYTEIGDRLFALIRPYYKSMRRAPGTKPQFRRSLPPTEVEAILQGVHEIIMDIKIAEAKAMNNRVAS